MGSGGIQVIILYLVIMGIIIVPQILTARKKRQKQQTMLDNLKSGDKIVTIGGICGTVLSISDKTVDIKIDKNVKLTVTKAAISNIVAE